MKFSRELRPKEGNCFVLLPHGDSNKGFDWDVLYKEVIASVISDVAMTPIRADEIYGSQPLMERIWKGIQEAEIVIADLTGRDPNVLYELGLAHVIWKTVVLLAQEDNDIPVDLREYAHIKYSTQGMGILQLTRELKKTLQAIRPEPKTEAGLYPLPGGGVEQVPAKVLTVTPEFAIVQASDGRKGFLDSDDTSWTWRSPDLTKFYNVGDELNGAFISGVKGEPKYSLTAVEENPWPKLEKKFPINQEFTGTVISTPSVGPFVKMDFGINGLIPASTLPRDEHLARGDEVKVITVRIDQATKNVELRFVRKLIQSQPLTTWDYSIGQCFDGTIVAIQTSSGYMLVQIADNVTGILHVRNMSESIRQQFERNELQIRSQLKVEIVNVDKLRQRIDFRDAPSARPEV